MLDIAKLAKKNKINTVVVSNGYINPEPLKELCKYVDAFNIDLKFFNNKEYLEYCKTKLDPVLESIKIIKQEKCWLEITNLMIEGLNDDL
jgi:pyruvate formate lyase activating enzyme